MRTRRTRIIVAILGGLYLAACLAVGFWPTPADRPLGGVVAGMLALRETGVPDAVGYGTLEALANVAFFVPVGALLAAVFPRRLLWVALLLAMALSGLIELGQLLLLPARFASWGDIIANSIGGAMGAAAVAAARRHRSRSSGAP
jgi:glycopeptide antibiotics resistance protein